MAEYVMSLNHQMERRLWDLRREEVVRCSDCAHHSVRGLTDGTRCSVCDRYSGISLALSSDGFCAWGERRANDGA